MKHSMRLICTLIALTILTGCAVAVPTPAAEAPAADAESNARTVEHALGAIDVPADPQRVVVLDAMDNVIALGIQPVGASNWMGTATGEQAAFPTYLDEETLAGIEWLGDNKRPNLETIVALQPDLILGRVNWHEEIYDQLAAIAPTYLVDRNAVGGWKGMFFAYADALNRTAEAEALMDQYDARTADLAQRLEQLSPVPEVSLVRFDPDRIVVYGPEIFAGSVMADAGVTRPPQQREIGRSQQISLEEIELIDADVLLTVAADPDESMLAELQQNPLWSQLRAVQNEQVYPVSFDIWVGGWTITGANLILDDLERRLLPNDAAAATPTTETLQVAAETDTHRLILHAGGETQVPLEPQCIVAAGSGYLDHLLTLGVTPCGAAHGPGGSGFPAHLADRLADVEYVGGTLEVNLERVAFLDPDLILAMHPAHSQGDFATNFDPIAPTVYLTEPWRDWRQALLEMGLVLGKSAEAAAALDAFDARLDAAQAVLADAISDEKVLFLRVLPQEIRVYGTASPTGDILFNGLGLAPSTLGNMPGPFRWS